MGLTTRPSRMQATEDRLQIRMGSAVKVSAVTVWTTGLVCAGCYAGAALGTILRFPQIGNAALFLPYGILTSALLLSPPRRWWIYMLAASAGNFWPHFSDGAPVTFVLMAEIANQARALVAAAGVRRFGDADGRLDTLRGVSVFLLFAAVLGPVVGAFIGGGAVWWHHHDNYWLAWQAWLTSNTLTGLTLVPAILISVTKAEARTRARTSLRVLEAVLLAVALLLVGSYVLLERDGASSHLLELVYVLTPLLLWAAVRFGLRGTSASLLIIAILAICGALDGRGPFVTRSAAGFVGLQLFLFATSVPLLLLSVLLQEQRRTAKALRESRRRFRMVVDNQPEIICRFRPDGTLTFVNRAFCRSVRRAPNALLGTSFWSLFPVEEGEARREIVDRLKSAGPPVSWEGERQTESGEWIWEQWRVHAHFSDEESVGEYQAVGLDITERKRGEEDRRLLEAERLLAEALRETDQRKDEFLAMLAHELHNPLAAITMVIETMRLKPSPDEQARWARELIGGQVAQLKRLVDDLLDISRINRGKIRVQMDPIDLAEVVATAIQTSRPLIIARGVEFVTDVPRAPLPIRGDAARLIQVVSNLLNNAAKYTSPGGCIRLAVIQDGAFVVMRFTDQGVGIPRHMLHRVFEPFTQVDRARDGALGGLGLGLTLVRQLTEMHGGTVQAHSDGPGRGSEFIVRIPIEGRDARSIADCLTETEPAAAEHPTIDAPPVAAIAS